MPSVATIVALGGLLFTAAQLANERSATKEQLALLSVQTANETFAQAITALGDDRMPIRVGGIYVLQQVAETSQTNYWRAISVLTAYLHEQIPYGIPTAGTPTAREGNLVTALAADIQAVVTALRERNQEWDDGRALDLSRLNLQSTNLREARLKGVILSYSSLSQVDLTGADLSGATLTRTQVLNGTLVDANLTDALLSFTDFSFAHLEGATLRGATVSDVRLSFAFLNGAQLQGVTFERTDFTAANLTGANLEGADLSTATGLNQTQIASAIIDESTRLPWETNSGSTTPTP